MTTEDFMAAEVAMSRPPGSCMTMGTASTMASMAEALGVALPQNAAIPAVDARRRVLAEMTGRAIVELVRKNTRLSDILTKKAFENAIRVNGAIGGSTNAVIHLIAIAGRLGIDLTLDDWDRLGCDVPTLVDLQPSGRFLMEEFYYAGGPIWDAVADAPNHDAEVIRDFRNPLTTQGGIAMLRGNLVPNGAVIKPSAATPELMVHRGRAVVFENIEDYKSRIADPDLDIDETCVMVLKNCGPIGYPGMAEVGNMGLPPKLLARGVTDMVRISDARMPGTAFGTVVLHAAPEAAAGGPLAVAQTGDLIALDVPARTLTVEISERELANRLATWQRPETPVIGYQGLYVSNVLQADKGADFAFLRGLRGQRGAAIPRNSH